MQWSVGEEGGLGCNGYMEEEGEENEVRWMVVVGDHISMILSFCLWLL